MLSGNKSQIKPVGDEVTQYLDGGSLKYPILFYSLHLLIILDPIDAEPLPFWREHQGRLPTIAALAQDVLSIPATGAGVERLFNTARDICHYRRGRMKSETIEELMMFLYTSRLDLKEQQRKELEKYFSLDEIKAIREENDKRLNGVKIDPISDTKEQVVEGEDSKDSEEEEEDKEKEDGNGDKDKDDDDALPLIGMNT
jgi:hypothetical protein